MQGSYNQLSSQEIDLLLLFYTFADQHGWVDIVAAERWARQTLGFSIKTTPFKMTQDHIDVLVQYKMLPDISEVIKKAKKQ